MSGKSVRVVGVAMTVLGFVFIAKAGGNAVFLLCGAGLVGTGLGLLVLGDPTK